MGKYSDIKIPAYRYFPSDELPHDGPRQWARIRLLQACERLDIPEQLWPKFKVNSPEEWGYMYPLDRPLYLPSFHPLYESEAEWREKARMFFDKYMDINTHKFRALFAAEIKQKKVTRIKQTRDTTPLNLRYEWAAKRYCLNVPYKDLVKAGYNEDRIKKSVAEIFKEAGIKKGK